MSLLSGLVGQTLLNIKYTKCIINQRGNIVRAHLVFSQSYYVGESYYFLGRWVYTFHISMFIPMYQCDVVHNIIRLF